MDHRDSNLQSEFLTVGTALVILCAIIFILLSIIPHRKTDAELCKKQKGTLIRTDTGYLCIVGDFKIILLERR